MFFLKIIHLLISATNPLAMKVTFKPSKSYPLYYFTMHRNGVQYLSKQRTGRLACQSPMGHECLVNDQSIILMTGIDRTLSIFYESRCATVSHQFIHDKMSHIHIGILEKKQSQKNIRYRNEQKQQFWDAFWYIRHDCLNITLYDPVLIWEYVYVSYLPNLSARAMVVSHSWKHDSIRYVRHVIIIFRDNWPQHQISYHVCDSQFWTFEWQTK